MKKSFLIFILICGVMLTGCAQLTELDDKQSDELAEYMAGTVLRYSKNYDEALIYPQDTKDSSKEVISGSDNSNTDGKTPSGSTIGSETSGSSDTDKTKDSTSLKNLFEIISDGKYLISYDGHTSHTSFPIENEYFTIEPTKGNKLLAFSFDLKNTATKPVDVDFVDKAVSYTLTNNSGKNYRPAVTLLTNDIQHLKGSIKAGKSLSAVLVFEVPSDINDMELSLVIKYNNKSSVINLDK